MTTRRPSTAMRIRAAGVTAGLLAALALSGCTTEEAPDVPHTGPATLTAVAGTNRYQVTLTAAAADRLGVRTSAVHAVPAGAAGVATGVRTSVPYAAVVYDANGATWAYTVVGTHSYVRTALGIATIQGDTAYLTAGPPVGTPVVVVGAPELLGAEYKIAGEE